MDYRWRGLFDNGEVERLHAEGFSHDLDEGRDWLGQTADHSLGWVCARDDGQLVGWVNVAWDGTSHAFILDTVVQSGHRHRHIAASLIGHAAEGAREAGCQWLHVDYSEELAPFYIDACGFRPTSAGVMHL